MRTHLTYKRLPTDTKNGYGLQITLTYYSAIPDQIIKLEEYLKQIAGTLLVFETKESDESNTCD